MNPFVSEIIRQAIYGVSIGGIFGFSAVMLLSTGGFCNRDSGFGLVTALLFGVVTFSVGVLVGLVI
jgi:hypothetical protein